MINCLPKKLVKIFSILTFLGLTFTFSAQTFSWSQAGPIYNAGRSRNMVVDKNDPSGNTLYVGSASSGVFFSTDGGANWNAVALTGNKLNVSYLAQATDGTIYVATGEGFLRPGQKLGAQPGTGLYKISGGALTLVAPSSMVGTVINRIACSPSSPNKIALATNLGIMVTTDGSNFTLASGIPTATTISGQDVKFNSSGILYCSAGNENATNTSSANEYSCVYKSSDNNFTSFSKITTLNSPLLQDDFYGRIELAIAPTNNNIIYASCASKYAGTSAPASPNLKGLFVSYDAGATWGLILQGSPQLDPLSNGETCLFIGTAPNGGSISSGDYAHVLVVDPFNANKLHIGSYQYYHWTRNSGTDSNPVGTWVKNGCTFLGNNQFSLPENIHDIKFILSGNTVSKSFFVTDAGIYRSIDLYTNPPGFASFQPYYKGLITGQFNSVSIERFPLSNTGGGNIIPYSGFIGGTGGNGLNYFSGNFPLVTSEVNYVGGDIYEAELSKILPNAAYFTAGSGRLYRSTDVRTSDPSQVLVNRDYKSGVAINFENSIYNVYNSTGTPFKLWENYGKTPVSPDSVVFYNDTLQASASMQGVATLTTQTTFSFSPTRPNSNALIDSIVVRTGTVVLPITGPGANAPAFTNADKKDINIKLSNTYTVAPTGTTSPGIVQQFGPVVSSSTSVLLNVSLNSDGSINDRVSVTFTTPPFLAKTTASSSSVSDFAAYYRVFCTVFYKYKTGDIVSVVDENISTKPYTYTTALTQPLTWAYGSTLPSFTMSATNAIAAVSNPTFVLASPGVTYTPSSSPTFTVRPITSTAYTIFAYGNYTVSGRPVTHTILAIPAGTNSIPNPTYNLQPGNVTQTSTVFVVTPTANINYTITETGTSTNTAFTYSNIGATTYSLNPGGLTQPTPIFTVTTPTTGLTTYTILGLSSNVTTGVNTSSTSAALPIRTFSTIGYGTTPPLSKNNPLIKMANVRSARLAICYGPSIFVSKAPLNLNDPLNLIKISANRCLTTDGSGNKLSGASNTVAVTGTVTTMEWSKSGTELYYATNDITSGNTFLYRVSYIDALLDSTRKSSYEGKLHTNIFTYSNTVAPDGSKNNPNSPYRTTLLGTFTNVVTSISVTEDDKAIALTFDNPTGTKVMYSTVADIRKCDASNAAIVSKNGSGLNVSKVYCSLMEKSDNKKVFVGTDLGVYYTNDITAASPNWVDANNNQLPIIQVFDLKQQTIEPWECYNSGVIYVATNGRGVWVNKDFSQTSYVSVNELEHAKTQNNLNLFPNPTNGMVFVAFNSNDTETASINVMDINGRIVKTENLGKLNSGEVKFSFDTNELASGMYIVTINSNSNIKRTAKLVITK